MAAHVRFRVHFIQAHVDVTAALVDKVSDGDSVRLTFELASETMCADDHGYCIRPASLVRV